MESIPKESYQELTTFLSETRAGGNQITRRQVARRSSLDEATIQVVLSELCDNDILQAKVKIRCPHCSTGYGTYTRRSNIPHETKHCFNCQNAFEAHNERSWEVIYEVANDPGDFFQSRKAYLEYFVETKRDHPPEFFVRELKRFEQMDNKQKRGREFDYLMGLLFQQLPNVEVRLKETGTAPGEIDVHIVCLNAKEWLYRLLGSHSIVENKWETDPIETSAISTFRGKTASLNDCSISYIASMSGYSRGSGKETGALHEIRKYKDPKMVDLWRDDIEEMMEDGTPEKIIREKQL